MGTDRTVSPRVATIIIVAIVGAALLVGLLAGDDTGDGAATDAVSEDDSSDGDSPSAGPTTSDDADTGPDVPPIECQGLITQSETDDALGTWERDDLPSSLELQQGETCVEQFADEPEFFVSIGPGEISDFLAEARLGGANSLMERPALASSTICRRNSGG